MCALDTGLAGEIDSRQVRVTSHPGRKFPEKRARAEAATDPTLQTEIRQRIDIREKLGVGGTAHDIAGVDLDGEDFKLSDYRGKIVFLDFWGDW